MIGFRPLFAIAPIEGGLLAFFQTGWFLPEILKELQVRNEPSRARSVVIIGTT